MEDDPEFDDEIGEEFEKFLQEQQALYQWWPGEMKNLVLNFGFVAAVLR